MTFILSSRVPVNVYALSPDSGVELVTFSVFTSFIRYVISTTVAPAATDFTLNRIKSVSTLSSFLLGFPANKSEDSSRDSRWA